jgi:hypothetical protein
MKTLHDLKKLAEHYRNMVQHCADVIKNLNGYTPDGFKFAFSIRDALILSIPIGEEEGNFCLGVFMSWHQFYSRKLKELEGEIQIREEEIPADHYDSF